MSPSMPSPIVTGAEYLTLPRAPETWLIDQLVPASGSCLIYGDPKVGKSFAAAQMAMSIQSGKEWLGFPVKSTGPCVYIQLDTPRSIWADRLTKMRAYRPGEDLPYCADLETLDTFPFDILNPSHADLLTVSLREVQPIAVIIDTIREAHSGEENDSTTMRNVMTTLKAVTHPAALIIVAHSRKAIAGQDANLMNDNWGNNYVVGKVDTIIRFNKKSFHYDGRAIEENTVKAHQIPRNQPGEGCWILTSPPKSSE